MPEDPEGEGRGIKVIDKRRFTADGHLRDDAPPDEGRRSDPPQPEAKVQEPPRESTPRQPQPGERPPIDFMSFVASLATNAMAALGVLPPDMGRDLPFNPELAREYIDILSMLQEKTRGNLTPQEDQALQRIVTDLRLNFVEVSRKGPPKP